MLDSNIRATMFLADHAQVANGKLNAIGAGWTLTGPQPSPFALCALVEFPWSQLGTEHTARFELVDDEGRPVPVETPNGEQPMSIELRCKIVGGLDAPRGAPLAIPVAINMPPQLIAPGGRYEWRLLVDDETEESWRAGFSTRALPRAA